MVRRILYFLIFTILIGCTEAIEPTPAQDFFPISDGNFWEYEIEEINYSLTQVPVINQYLLKETLVKISDLEYKIEVSTRTQSESVWKIKEVNLLTISGNRISRNENGKSIIVFYTPISDNLKWNKNDLNTDNETIISTKNFGDPYQSFQNTVQVIEKEDSSLINKNVILSIYADKTGLVYKENTSIAYCQSNSDCIGSGKIDSGKSFKMKLINSGIK